MTTPHRPPSVPFMGLQLARITQNEFVEWIVERGRQRTWPCRVGYLNAAQVNLVFGDSDTREVFESFECLYADGQSAVWAARFLGHPIPERVNAGDFTREFFEGCAAAGLRVGLVGGYTDVVKKFAALWLSRIPGLDIAFVHHGFFYGDEAVEQVRDALEEADPDIVLMGMGAPVQEWVTSLWSKDGKPRVWWCVGALFEYDAGERARAPVWMRRAGLEWAFRLALEPRRLAGRYLIGNPLFVVRVLREKIWGR